MVHSVLGDGHEHDKYNPKDSCWSIWNV